MSDIDESHSEGDTASRGDDDFSDDDLASVSKKPSRFTASSGKDDFDDSEIDEDDEEEEEEEVDENADEEDAYDDDEDDEPKQPVQEEEEEDDDVENDAEEDDAEEEVDEAAEDDEEGRPATTRTKLTSVPLEEVLQQALSESEHEDEDEDTEDYLQKFDAELNKNYIYEFHPECLNHNSAEVALLATVVRDEAGNIVDPLHRTVPFLTKYEKARVLGQRAKQIEVGAKPFIKVAETVVDSYIIAELELREKKIPFIIKRPIPGGAFEYWHLSDLENINF